MKIWVMDRAKKKFLSGLAEFGVGDERFIIGSYVIKLYGSPSVVSATLGTFFML